MRRHDIAAVLILLLTPMGGCLDSFSSNRAPVATFIVSADGTSVSEGASVRVKQVVTFDATASADDDGDALDYQWVVELSGKRTELTNVKATYTPSDEGNMKITLTVSDGSKSATLERSIKIVAEDTAAPTAEAGGNEGTGTSRHYLVVIDVAKEDSDRVMDETTSVEIDASESAADPGEMNAYITDWIWDLDTTTDSDGDGVTDNDDNQRGKTYTMENVAPGYYPIKLTVIDNNGLTDEDEVVVYVNWKATWEEMTVGRNLSNSDNDVDFQFTAFYTSDSKTKERNVRSVEAWVVHPDRDDDWNGIGAVDDNRLDLFAKNESDEDVSNTTQQTDEQRKGNGICDLEDGEECAYIYLSRSQFRMYDDGEWTILVVNGERHDTELTRFVVKVTYKS